MQFDASLLLRRMSSTVDAPQNVNIWMADEYETRASKYVVTHVARKPHARIARKMSHCV